jgi:elongation factor G
VSERRYRETVTRTVEVVYVHKRRIGGAGEFAQVRIRLEPLARGAGEQFANEALDFAVPQDWIAAIEEGIREAARKGVLTGGAVVDFKATLLDGAHHEVDSTWLAFKLAAQGGFWEAMRKAGPKQWL